MKLKLKNANSHKARNTNFLTPRLQSRLCLSCPAYSDLLQQLQETNTETIMVIQARSKIGLGPLCGGRNKARSYQRNMSVAENTDCDELDLVTKAEQSVMEELSVSGLPNQMVDFITFWIWIIFLNMIINFLPLTFT